MSEYFSPFSGGGWGFALSRFPQNMSCTRFPRRFFFHHVLTHYYYAFRYYSTFTLRSLHSLYSSFISLLLISPYSLIPSGHIFLFASMLLFSPLRRGTLFIHVTLSTALLFDWIFDRRFTSPFRHIRSLAQCLQIFKKNSIFYGLRFSIHVFLCFEKKAVCATFSSSILQRFKNPKTLQFMRSA